MAELLLAEYYRRAVATGLFRGSALGALRRAGFDEREHYAALELVLTGAGEAPPVAEDFEFAIPAAAFRTRSTAVRLGLRLERAVLGSYVAAAEAIDNRSIRRVFVRVAASESEHVSALSRLASARPVGGSFPAPLDLEAAGAVLGPYLG